MDIAPPSPQPPHSLRSLSCLLPLTTLSSALMQSGITGSGSPPSYAPHTVVVPCSLLSGYRSLSVNFAVSAGFVNALVAAAAWMTLHCMSHHDMADRSWHTPRKRLTFSCRHSIEYQFHFRVSTLKLDLSSLPVFSSHHQHQHTTC